MGLLPAQVESLFQNVDQMVRIELDAEHLADEALDAEAGPDIRAEPVGGRALAQRSLDRRPLFLREAARPP
jgi:hypothetical protein